MKAVLFAAGVVAAVLSAGARRVGDVRFNAFSAQDNGDGTTTIRADFLGKQGLLLLLR